MVPSMVDAVSWSDPLEQLDSVATQDHPVCKADYGCGGHRDPFAAGDFSLACSYALSSISVLLCCTYRDVGGRSD